MIQLKGNPNTREYKLVIDEAQVVHKIKVVYYSSETTKEIYEKEINSSDIKVDFVLPSYDGTYIITATDVSGIAIFSRAILQYDYLLKFIRKGIDGICYDCGPVSKLEDCTECNSISKEDLALYTAVDYYFDLGYITYKPILEYLKNEYLREIGSDIEQFINMQRVNGIKLPLDYPAKKLTLMKYAAIALGAIAQTSDKEEQENLKEYYGYNKYLRCFNKYNFRLEDMLDSIDNISRVFYWQTSMSQQIGPIADMISPEYLQEYRSQPYRVFEQGYKIELNQVGKLAIAIQFADLGEYKFTDVLGNDITDMFDSIRLEEESTVLFLSKTHYIPSQVFIKIKRK